MKVLPINLRVKSSNPFANKIEDHFSGLIGIFILLLMFFISNVNPADTNGIIFEESSKIVEGCESAPENENESQSLVGLHISKFHFCIVSHTPLEIHKSSITNSDHYFSQITPPPESNFSRTF